MNIIEIENLNAYFGNKQVLHDINLVVKAGRKLAIVGESGSGKTVLAQGIMQLNPAARFEGRLKFQGVDLLSLSARALRKLRGREIGMVFQEPMTALNPVMRVGQQIAEVLTQHVGLPKKTAWAQAVALLEETGIQMPSEKARAFPFQLSGGQRQRAMIAQAVAAEPKLLIADEPTTALDVAVQAQVLDLLSRLQVAQQMTLIYISHDLNLVRHFADDVVVMKNGRIVEQGEAATVFANPQHEYTKMLLGIGSQDWVNDVPEVVAEVLSAENISVVVRQKTGWFCQREKVLLEPLSFELKAGETLGIIGESGSGKTTLAKALMHLMPHQGHLKLSGEDWQPSKRRDMQMVFQDPFGAFNPRMNVLQIVSEALHVHEPQLDSYEIQTRVKQMLLSVGLPDDILYRYPHAFSGGQRQRLAIARALVVRPKILLLDEPTSALDAQWRQQILALLSDLQRQYGLSLILISHDLAVIRALSHRVLVLKDGKVVEAGMAKAVFDNPHAAYTQNLLLHASPCNFEH